MLVKQVFVVLNSAERKHCWTANFTFRKFHTVWRIGTNSSLLKNVKFAYGQFR